MVEKRRSADENPQERSIIQLTESQLKEVVIDGINEAFTRLGVDTTQPLEMQKDFQHLREWRLATSALQRKGLLALVTILVTGACAAAWLGLKSMLLMKALPPGQN